jgi:hypothetical protein
MFFMCVLTADTSDITGTTFLVDPAGPVTLQIASLTGSVIFDQTATVVKDSKGKQVAGTSFPAPDTYSFTTSAGQSYTLETGYICAPPNSTGELNEAGADCIQLSDILSSTLAQTFTIKA